MKNQPAVKLGTFLKLHRQKKGFIARVFGGLIWLSPSRYAELEAGVVKWLGDKQEALIKSVLGLTGTELTQFDALVKSARSGRQLKFSELFDRSDLAPVRLHQHDGKQITETEKEEILDAVFAELA